MSGGLNLEHKPRLDLKQVNKSVKALLKHCRVERANKNEQQSTFFDLQIALIKVPPETKTKPKLVHLRHPFRTLHETNICIFTPDPLDKYLDIVQAEVPSATVISLKQLRTKYKPAAIKKKLCNEFDVFFAHQPILSTISPLLGKPFFDRRKQPAGIKLKKGSIEEILENAVESTRILVGTGPCVNVHIAITDQSMPEIAENIIHGMDDIARILQGWDNIKKVHIKTDFSISLPLYNADEYSDSDSDSEF